MSRPTSPNHIHQTIQRWLLEAEQAWDRQDYMESIRLVERASKLDPGNPSLLLNLARAHGLRYDYAVAERCLERAVEIAPSRARTLSDAGSVCLEFEHVEMGIRFLERSGQHHDAPIGALMTLADIMIRDARADDAAVLIDRASKRDRQDPRVLLEEASLRRLRGKDDEAESLLRDLLAKPGIGAAVQLRGHYELAGILDRTGQYDDAMAHYLEAKAVQRKTATGPYAATAQLMHRRAREMEGTITGEVLARWREDAAKLMPPRRIALLCGHPRSGTTLLEQVLDAHPDLVSAEETKLMHDEAYLPLIRDFPEGTSILRALDSVPCSVIAHARENYFRCVELVLQKPVGGRLLVDKNPALNLLIPMVVRAFPEVKLLVALRDPRDVVLSCFQQALPLTPVSYGYLTLEGTVKQYASVMGFWLKMRPRLGDQWIEVRYETMIEDLPAVARRTLDFLGVEYDEKVLKFYEHARTKRVRSPSHADVTKPVYRTAIGRWRNYQKYLEPHLAGLEPFIKEFKYE